MKESRAKKTQRVIRKAIILIILIFSVAPIILSALPLQLANSDYSIYETGEFGLSTVRTELEQQIGEDGKPAYNIYNLASSLHALNRLNETGVLVSIGPSTSYEQIEFVSLLLFLLKGGSLVIADDFGTGNEILAPLFDLLNNFNQFQTTAKDSYGFEIPDFSEIIQGGGGSSGGLTDSLSGLLGEKVVRFGFNNSVLMDIGNNQNNPNRPIIIDVDQTGSQYSFTQGVSKVQTELATIISVQLNQTRTVPSETPGGSETNISELVWYPLTKIGFTEHIPSNLGVLRQLDYLFPLYSSDRSWIETNIQSAINNEAVPDLNEWGNIQFSIALTLPIIPGGGKIVFIGDPSIFTNRWTSRTQENDNLLLVSNLMKMVTSHLNPGNKTLIFDFGHTYQTLASPAFYAIVILRFLANISMFPLLTLLFPLIVIFWGRGFIPKRSQQKFSTTKVRVPQEKSRFEKKIEQINKNRTYGEAIKLIMNRLKTQIRKHVNYFGSPKVTLEEIVEFMVNKAPNHFDRKQLRKDLQKIFKVIAVPKKQISKAVAHKHLVLIKDLITEVDRLN